MHKLLMLTLVVASVGEVAFAKISGDIKSQSVSEIEYFRVDVDKSVITDEDVIELSLDIQFDLGNTDSEQLTMSGDDKAHGLPTNEESGYKITIRLPMALEWKEHGERLKIRIHARTTPQAAVVDSLY